MRSAKSSLAVLGLAGVLFSGCGWRVGERSPESCGQGEFIIQQRHLTRSGIRITFRKSGKEVVMMQVDRDFNLGLTEAYCSKDSNLAGLAVCDRGTEALVLAIDTRTMKPMNTDLVKRAISDQIRRTYSVPIKQDPLIWACDNEGTSAYLRRSRE